jgi:proteic killer suppression protein
MIKSFKHKGLKQFFEKGSTTGIRPDQANKIRLRLAALDAADTVEDMSRPGYALHQLKGNKKGLWAISVTGNWRITFEFIDGNAYIVNYEDYH